MGFVSLLVALDLMIFFQGIHQFVRQINLATVQHKTCMFILRTFADIMNSISRKYPKLHHSISAKVFTIWHIWGLFCFFGLVVYLHHLRNHHWKVCYQKTQEVKEDTEHSIKHTRNQCSLPAAEIVAQSMSSEQQLLSWAPGCFYRMYLDHLEWNRARKDMRGPETGTVWKWCEQKI